MIKINGARKTYGSLVAVDNVTTEIAAGGVTSIIGPNGGGKTTLLSLISRLSAVDKDFIDTALNQLDLMGMADKFIDELSGGQRQRAFIAMVLAQDTEYLLLDEPLNNLDMKHSVEMMRLVRRLANDLGKTVVVVVHDINFASCYSDNIVALRDGKLIHQGPPEQIMQTHVLRDIYDIDIRIEQIDGHRIGVYFT